MQHDDRLKCLSHRCGNLHKSSKSQQYPIELHDKTHLSPLVLLTSLAPAHGATPTSTTTPALSWEELARCFASFGPNTEHCTVVRPCETVAEPSEAG